MDGTFADRLRAARHAAGLSQQELAERAGLTVNAIGQLERGVRTRPYPHTVRVLADALGFDEASRVELLQSVPSRSRGPAASGPPAVGAPPRLPALPAGLIGREADITAILTELQRNRLVTLTGPGGVGKTSLALAVAHASNGTEVVFMPLATATNAATALRSVAHALGVPDVAADMADRVVAALQERPVLLVLDNLEQIADAGPAIAYLLDRTTVSLLVTSRSPLHLSHEQIWPVGPLMPPSPGAGSEELRASAAVQLLLERARRVDPAWVPHPAHWPVIGEICRRLDGLPLAIELAAAWLAVLSPADLLARLADSLDLLADQRHDVPDRHRTMRAAVAWSYGLLAAETQALLRALSVFPAAFDLESAAAVADAVEGSVLRGLAVLTERSLVQRVALDGRVRFRMLETVRAFATERLAEADEESAVRDRHVELVGEFTRQADTGLDTAAQASWVREVEERLDDIRTALRWQLSTGDIGGAALLYSQLRMIWHVRHAGEGMTWGDRILEHEEQLDPRLRGSARSTMALLEFATGHLTTARRRAEAAVEDSRAAGHDHETSLALTIQANIAVSDGDAVAAETLGRSAATAADAVADPTARALARGLASLARIRAATANGDLATAARLLEASDRDLAVAGQPWARAFWLNLAIAVDQARGETAAVPARLRESIELCLQLDDVPTLLYALARLGSYLRAQEDLLGTARVLGAIADTVERTGYRITDPTARAWLETDTEAVTQGLGPETVDSAMAEGASLGTGELVAVLLPDSGHAVQNRWNVGAGAGDDLDESATSPVLGSSPT